MISNNNQKVPWETGIYVTSCRFKYLFIEIILRFKQVKWRECELLKCSILVLVLCVLC